MKTSYAHQKALDDSIYQGGNEFSKVVRIIPSPQEKIFIFEYQKDLKTIVLHYRKIQLTLEENAKKQSAEREAKESLASSSFSPVDQSKEKGKFFVEYPTKYQPSSTLQALLRSVEIKKILHKIRSEVEAQVAVSLPQPKKQKVQEAIP